MSEWATLRRHGPVGMITLRADLATPALPTRIEGALGLAVPGTRAVVAAGAKTLLWMSPDELLLVLPPSEVTQTLGALADALKNDHHLAVDVSDARAMFHLGGPGAREVLAKLAPVDLHPDHFGRGEGAPLAPWADRRRLLDRQRRFSRDLLSVGGGLC